MGRRSGPRAAAAWIVIAAELAWLVAGLGLLPEPAELPYWAQAIMILLVASFGLVGALVATRRPRNAVGWTLWASAVVIAAVTGASEYVYYSLATFGGGLPGTVAVAWLSSISVLPAFAGGVIFVPLLFPTGHPLTPRWRWAVAFAAVSLVATILPPMFTPGPLSSYPAIENPVGIPVVGSLAGLAAVANGPGFLVSAVLAIASCVLRFRRGSAVERQQLKWLAAATAVTLTFFVMAASQVPTLSDLGWMLGIVTLNLIPVAIGIAILRFRLFEIDRIISRTIGWALVTAILGAVFVVAIVGLESLLSPVTANSTLAVAASTLVAAALFQPLRRRVQRAVDRRFNRSRVDADRALAAFAAQVRDQVDLGQLDAAVTGTVRTAIGPSGAGLWLRAAPRGLR